MAAPLLPVEGLRYYLVHTNSGKFVHPKGGSDNPGNETHLVFHEPVKEDKHRIELQFIFENGQLKHYSSGKYVHPRGGHVGANVPLCLFKDCDGERTGIKLVRDNENTYLQHTQSGYYVHPKEGNISPSNDTELVYFQTCRPGIAIKILPSNETVKLVNTEFDTAKLASLPTETVVAQTTMKNESKTAQVVETCVDYSRSLTNTFTFRFREKISFNIEQSTKIGASIPGLVSAEAAVKVSFGLELEASQASTNTTTKGVRNTINIIHFISITALQ